MRVLVIGQRRPGAGDRLGVPPTRPRDDARLPSSQPGSPSSPTSSSPAPRPRWSPASPTSAPAAASRASARRAELARLESSKGYARELATKPRHPRSGASPASQSADHDAAIAWYRAARSPGGRQARRPGGRQGRHRSRLATKRRSPRSVPPTGPFVLEERMTGPECSLIALCDGTDRRRPAARPGPQAHRRGRHRPEHRRDGRLRPGAGAATTATSSWPRSSSRSSTTSPPPARRTSACSTPG